jgi:hypothetical protein
MRRSHRSARHVRTPLPAVGAALVLLAVVALPTSAQAEEPSVVTCAGEAEQHYSPGLTLTSRPTSVSSSFEYDCLGSAEVTAVSSGFGPITVEAGCLLGDLGGTSSLTYHWDDDTTSTFENTYIVTRPLGQTIVSATGEITSGRFAGSTAQSLIVYIAPALTGCLTSSGVSSVEGIASFTVLG